MTLKAKKKLCSFCGKEDYLWRSNPATCRKCEGKRLSGVTLKMKQSPLTAKPKPRINGKPLHTAIYMAAFGYGDADFVSSELSGQKAQDVHHILCKGMGSSKYNDRIENLMALTREEHEEYGDKKQYMSFLFEKHLEVLKRNGVKHDEAWIMGQVDKYC